ncbi:MAG: DUF2085 domain-containing protein [Myxococcales bacterium]|nr:DUF2085 domain-containing protein [Myxococcales bacterium]
MASFTLAPMLWPDGAAAISARMIFSGLCHQDPARSFAIDGHPMAVCHRCTGIYFGLAAGALAALAFLPDPSRKRYWAAGIAPLALQVLLAWIWPALDLFWLRTLTGAIAGVTGGLLLASAVTPRSRGTSRVDGPEAP